MHEQYIEFEQNDKKDNEQTTINYTNATETKTENKRLIKQLTDTAPQIENKNGKNRSNHNPFYDMISYEHTRYVITDLIVKRNNNRDIVTDSEIRKLLNKWKYNVCDLYLTLLTEYGIDTHDVDTREYTKNMKIYRLCYEYKMGKKLGRGAFAVVKQAKRVSDDKYFAAKIINKSGLNKWDLRGLRTEIAIMRDLSHENIVRLYDVFESLSKIGLIIGLLRGGELLEVVIEKGSFSENEASQCFAQLCDGLNYIHHKRIAHRDIKPDNLLFSDKIRDWNRYI